MTMWEDPIDGTRSVALVTKSLRTTARNDTPMLIVRCKDKAQLEVFVSLSRNTFYLYTEEVDPSVYVYIPSFVPEQYAPVRVRFDNGAPEKGKWKLNRTGKAAFGDVAEHRVRRGSQSVFEKMLQHTTLYFGFLVISESAEQVAEFRLDGLADAARERFQGACMSKVKTLKQ